MGFNSGFKGLNAELNPICHSLALLGAHHILHVSRIRVNYPERNKVSILIKLATLSASRPAVLNQGYMDRLQEVRKLGWENNYIIFSNM